MSMTASMTIGGMLAAADARFAETGGYKATADFDARCVELIHQDAEGAEIVISSDPMRPGVADEDIAHDLLVAEIGADAAAETYFVITYR